MCVCMYVCMCVYCILSHLYSRNQAASRRANLNTTFNDCYTHTYINIIWYVSPSHQTVIFQIR